MHGAVEQVGGQNHGVGVNGTDTQLLDKLMQKVGLLELSEALQRLCGVAAKDTACGSVSARNSSNPDNQRRHRTHPDDKKSLTMLATTARKCAIVGSDGVPSDASPASSVFPLLPPSVTTRSIVGSARAMACRSSWVCWLWYADKSTAASATALSTSLVVFDAMI